MSWTHEGRRKAGDRATERYLEYRREAGLAPSREEHALRLAERHIVVDGATAPKRLGAIEPWERYGKLVNANPNTKTRHGVSYRLYVAAFQVCLRAIELGIEPRYDNLDLVDSPAPLTPEQRKRYSRAWWHRTGDAPEHGDGAPRTDISATPTLARREAFRLRQEALVNSKP